MIAFNAGQTHTWSLLGIVGGDFLGLGLAAAAESKSLREDLVGVEIRG